MTEPVPRAVVENFYQALLSSDLNALDRLLDDNVAWTISGPVDFLPFCGRRSGKAGVLTMLGRDVPAVLFGRRFIVNAMLIDGDSAAVLGKVTATKSDDGHAVSYRIAQFMSFRDGKVVEYTSIIDSFDAVEQVLGHALWMHDGPSAATGNLVPV